MLKPLEIRGNIAGFRPDTDPETVAAVLAATERLPRIQFEQPLPDALIDAAAAAVAANPSLPVRVHGPQIGPSLDFLSAFTHVRHLRVDAWLVTDFEPLRGLRELESLGLGQTKSHAASLGFLHSLPKLHTLWIEGHDRDFDAVGELSTLSHLGLPVPRAKSLLCLAAHPALVTLEMDFGGIRDLSPLLGAPGLRGLGIYQVRNFSTEDLAVLASLPRLEALSLGALRKVERLSLERLLALQTLDELAGCSALEELYLDVEARPADRRLSPLLGASSLKYVHVGGVFPAQEVQVLATRFQGRTLTYRNDLLRGSREDRGSLSWRRGVSEYIS